MAKLALRFRRLGVPVCLPELLPASARSAKLNNAYNPNLIFVESSSGKKRCRDIVPNELSFGNDGRILIVTGANQGGKTVFTQMSGVLPLMAQIGMYVPAEPKGKSYALEIARKYGISYEQIIESFRDTGRHESGGS